MFPHIRGQILKVLIPFSSAIIKTRINAMLWKNRQTEQRFKKKKCTLGLWVTFTFEIKLSVSLFDGVLKSYYDSSARDYLSTFFFHLFNNLTCNLITGRLIRHLFLLNVLIKDVKPIKKTERSLSSVFHFTEVFTGRQT